MVPGYREVRQLGAGHTGRVFLATYETTGAYVAIKYLNATLRRDAEFMERFRTDAASLVEIDDPHVVRLHEYVETPGRAAVVMELVDGVPLRALLAEHGHASPEAALVVLKGTLLALAAAHERGVAHRDVKPENVLVQADGTAKLGDFGVVVHAEEPGVPAGSPPYMAPELWTRGAAGPPADLYAAACLLFETVKGRPPFRGGGVAELRGLHLSEPVPLEVVPDTLRDLLRRGLAKDPADRYASARRFAAELEEDAVAGYGADWEQRGRRHLAELATLLALRFPLAPSGATAGSRRGRPLRDRLRRVPTLPPHLWIAGAAVTVMAIAIAASGDRPGRDPGTVLMPQDPGNSTAGDPADPRRSTTGDPADPARGRATATPRPSVPASSRPATSGPVAPVPASSRPVPSGQVSSGPPAPTSSSAVTAPTGRQGGGAPVVRSAGIVRWSGSAGSVRVSADGTGPVRLRIAYTRRDGDGPARTVARETRTLTGGTVYTSGVLRDLGDVPCGTRAHFGLLVATEPAADNGPQISEVEVDGGPCPSPTPTPPGTATATGAPTPTAGRAAAPPSPPTGVPTEPASVPTEPAGLTTGDPDHPTDPPGLRTDAPGERVEPGNPANPIDPGDPGEPADLPEPIDLLIGDLTHTGDSSPAVPRS
ncbi:serine/threonine-protein kinase [Nonomuraea rhodomycinica]|uniref:non-specific serine/threonine protein kinase n=1 Tax=Nonomuraea rhodomycinica TaxID=1712872 RepID=A0A7Y6MB63_9ACTN|nr:serine/threonine-protein kinase [Nonomuraea rhodomycinica]NUW40580.1 protein kinase [Nonomuraea rhodomycinica]